MSIKRIVLEPGAIREPQWNVNANQLAYVVSGTVLVSLLGNADAFSSFVVGPRQMYHVESGAVYHIENVGDGTAEIIAALRHERPEHFSLQNSVNAMTDAVLGNTYDLPASAFAAFDRHGATQLVRRDGAARIPDTAGLPNARLFDLGGQLRRCRIRTAARSSPASSTGRRWRTCRCTRSRSAEPACASRTGTPSPPSSATSTAGTGA